MKFDLTENSGTKLCPFCAETIQQKALKCRFCGEMLIPEKIKSVEDAVFFDPEDEDNEELYEDDDVLFAARPSLWAIAPTFIKCAIFFALAVFLFSYPVENAGFVQDLLHRSPDAQPAESPAAAIKDNVTSHITLNEQQFQLITKYRVIFAIGLMILVPLWLAYKIIKLKCIYYEISEERIEFTRGIFDRQVDNLDMFRVIDLKLRRHIIDCIVGIGTVTLVTTDKSDPTFRFEKVRNSRALYDIIKTASLQADRDSNVIHME